MPAMQNARPVLEGRTGSAGTQFLLVQHAQHAINIKKRKAGERKEDWVKRSLRGAEAPTCYHCSAGLTLRASKL